MWSHRFSTSALVDALATHCSSLVVRAAREQAVWQARVQARHMVRRTI
jgi:hypothetical protein